MFSETKICKGLMLAFGSAVGLASTPAIAQEPQQLERVEITGSSIKRTHMEGVLPVEVYTRSLIARTGASTVNELLRSIPTVDFFDQGEMASNGPEVSGTATVRMRGLSETNVLVLLNGRRLPINALYASSGAGAAVDLNTIPLSAIDRIEILRDGASAIYGADAVAGVINFITRKNYSGLEARMGYGSTTRGDGTEKTGGLTVGHGDYDSDGFNFLASLDVFKRDPIFRKDRDISRSSDFTRFGGPDARSPFSPFGNVLDAQGNLTGATIRPCPAELFSGGYCRYDFNANDLITAYNGADRLSGLLIGSLKLPGNVRLTGEMLLAQMKNHFDAPPVPDFFVAPNGDLYTGRFLQGGPRMTDRKSDLSQFSLGLEGTVSQIDWRVDAGQGRSKVVNNDRNYFNRTLYLAATGSGAIDPTVTTNDQALVDSLKVTPRREGESTITFTNAKVSGEWGALAGGPIGYAVGSSVWREKLVDTPDALSQAGEVVGSVQQAAVNASRNVYALFGELALPVTKSLEGQLAARYDHYPNATSTSPKIGARYLITPALSVRGSYSHSFRAPSLKQIYGAREEGAAGFTSDALCAALSQAAGCTVTGFQVTGSNPSLQPEKGKNWNIGVVVEPMSGLSASVDWWRIKVRDAIDTPTIDQAVAAGKFSTDSLGRVTVETDLKNFSAIKTEGIDLDLRWRMARLPIGDVTLRNATTYYLHQQRLSESGQGWDEFNGTYATPRWRNVFTAGLDYGAWQATTSLRTTSGFYDTDEPNPNSAVNRKVSSHTEVDVTGSYTGLKRFKIQLGVKNLFDRMPPFSAQNALSGQYTQMGFAELYSSRGRFIYTTVNYTFF